MLKKFTFKKIAITTLLLLLALILYNYPEEINEAKNISDKAKMNIYLIDENDFVSMTKIDANDNSDVEKQIKLIVESLTVGNDDANLPNGFKAIIPAGTKLLDYHLDNGMLKLNFNEKFLEIEEKFENKMIESLVFSLTTLKDVQKIMIFVNNERLTELPKSHKKLDIYLDRSYGINKVVDITNFHDTSMVTVYYLSKSDEYYYVPISYISNENSDKIEIIINNLKTNKLNNSNLLSQLDYQVELMNYEETEGEIILDFNDVLMTSVYDGELKEEVKYALSYSIYDTFGIENVIFMIDSEKIDEFRLEIS